MTNTDFKKLDASERPLFGPRRLILCGFDKAARTDFLKLIKAAEVTELDCLWVGESDGDVQLKALFKKPVGVPCEPAPDHSRAVIAGGISQKEFHLLMTLSREVGMPPTLWAVLTPTSATWLLNALLKELDAERNAMAARKREQLK